MAVSPPSQIVDGNGTVVQGPGWDPTTHQFVVPQTGPASTDSQSGIPYAPDQVQLVSGGQAPNPADSVAAANLLMLVAAQQSGTGLFTPKRLVTKFVQLKAQAVTAGTPVSVYTPTAGKKFRILSYHLSLSVAGSVLLEDTTGVEVLRTPLLAAGIGQASPEMGNGYLSTTANNQLFIDVTASGSVSGWIGVEEE